MAKRKRDELSYEDELLEKEVKKRPYIYNENDNSNLEGKSKNQIFQEITSNKNLQLNKNNSGNYENTIII